jgi:hypothetical protein
MDPVGRRNQTIPEGDQGEKIIDEGVDPFLDRSHEKEPDRVF